MAKVMQFLTKDGRKVTIKDVNKITPADVEELKKYDMHPARVSVGGTTVKIEPSKLQYKDFMAFKSFNGEIKPITDKVDTPLFPTSLSNAKQLGVSGAWNQFKTAVSERGQELVAPMMGTTIDPMTGKPINMEAGKAFGRTMYGAAENVWNTVNAVGYLASNALPEAWGEKKAQEWFGKRIVNSTNKFTELNNRIGGRDIYTGIGSFIPDAVVAALSYGAGEAGVKAATSLVTKKVAKNVAADLALATTKETAEVAAGNIAGNLAKKEAMKMATASAIKQLPKKIVLDTAVGAEMGAIKDYEKPLYGAAVGAAFGLATGVVANGIGIPINRFKYAKTPAYKFLDTVTKNPELANTIKAISENMDDTSLTQVIQAMSIGQDIGGLSAPELADIFGRRLEVLQKAIAVANDPMSVYKGEYLDVSSKPPMGEKQPLLLGAGEPYKPDWVPYKEPENPNWIPWQEGQTGNALDVSNQPPVVRRSPLLLKAGDPETASILEAERLKSFWDQEVEPLPDTDATFKPKEINYVEDTVEQPPSELKAIWNQMVDNDPMLISDILNSKKPAEPLIAEPNVKATEVMSGISDLEYSDVISYFLLNNLERESKAVIASDPALAELVEGNKGVASFLKMSDAETAANAKKLVQSHLVQDFAEHTFGGKTKEGPLTALYERTEAQIKSFAEHLDNNGIKLSGDAEDFLNYYRGSDRYKMDLIEYMDDAKRANMSKEYAQVAQTVPTDITAATAQEKYAVLQYLEDVMANVNKDKEWARTYTSGYVTQLIDGIHRTKGLSPDKIMEIVDNASSERLQHILINRDIIAREALRDANQGEINTAYQLMHSGDRFIEGGISPEKAATMAKINSGKGSEGMKQLIERMQPRRVESPSGKAYTDFNKDGKITLALQKNATIDDLFHEIIHIVTENGKSRSVVKKFLHDNFLETYSEMVDANGVITKKGSEAFMTAFDTWIRDPQTRLRGGIQDIFDNLRYTLDDTFNQMPNDAVNLGIFDYMSERFGEQPFSVMVADATRRTWGEKRKEYKDPTFVQKGLDAINEQGIKGTANRTWRTGVSLFFSKISYLKTFSPEMYEAAQRFLGVSPKSMWSTKEFLNAMSDRGLNNLPTIFKEKTEIETSTMLRGKKVVFEDGGVMNASEYLDVLMGAKRTKVMVEELGMEAPFEMRIYQDIIDNFENNVKVKQPEVYEALSEKLNVSQIYANELMDMLNEAGIVGLKKKFVLQRRNPQQILDAMDEFIEGMKQETTDNGSPFLTADMLKELEDAKTSPDKFYDIVKKYKGFHPSDLFESVVGSRTYYTGASAVRSLGLGLRLQPADLEDTIVPDNVFYAPMYRVLTEFSLKNMANKRTAATLLKSLEGSQAQLNSPLENLAMNVNYFTREAERNVFLRTQYEILTKYAKDNGMDIEKLFTERPASNVYEIADFEAELRRILKASGVKDSAKVAEIMAKSNASMFEHFSMPKNLAPDEIYFTKLDTVTGKSKKVILKLNDPLLADALTSPQVQANAHAVVELGMLSLRTLKSIQRAGITNLPAFAVGNVIRDMTMRRFTDTSHVTWNQAIELYKLKGNTPEGLEGFKYFVKDNVLGALPYDFVTEWIPTYLSLLSKPLDNLMFKKSAIMTQDLMKQERLSGGAGSEFYYGNNPTKFIKNELMKIDKVGSDKFAWFIPKDSAVYKAPGAALEFYKSLLSNAESATRLMNARHVYNDLAGGSKKSANLLGIQYERSPYGVNVGKQGRMFEYDLLNEPYIRAAYRNATADFSEMGTLGKKISQYTNFVTAGLAGARDEARGFAMNPMGNTIKLAMLTSTIIGLKLLYGVDDSKLSPVERVMAFHLNLPGIGLVRIPKPYGMIGTALTVGEVIANTAIESNDPKAVETLEKSAKQIFPEWSGLLGPVGNWIIGATLNKKIFFDTDITSRNLTGLPKTEQFNPSTTGFAKAASHIVPMAPTQIDYMGTSLLGGTYSLANRIVDDSVNPFLHNQRPSSETDYRLLKELTGASKFLYTDPDKTSYSQSIKEFYDNVAEAGGYKKQLVNNGSSNVSDYTKHMAKQAQNMNAYQYRISNLFAYIKKVQNDPDLDAREKREKLEKYTMKINILAQKANLKYYSAKRENRDGK